MTNPKQAPEAQRPICQEPGCGLPLLKVCILYGCGPDCTDERHASTARCERSDDAHRLCAQLAERDARIAELEHAFIEKSLEADTMRAHFNTAEKVLAEAQEALKSPKHWRVSHHAGMCAIWRDEACNCAVSQLATANARAHRAEEMFERFLESHKLDKPSGDWVCKGADFDNAVADFYYAPEVSVQDIPGFEGVKKDLLALTVRKKQASTGECDE